VEKDVLKPILVLFVLISILSGCSKLTPYLRVAEGARAYASGDYQRANIAYIDAGRYEAFEEWIAYDLGAVYYALGEVDAAESEWQIAAGSGDEELLYRVFFNYGVLLFERGSYSEAYEKFRNALEINPSGVEAKKNLELAMEKMEVSEGQGAPPVVSQSDDDTSGEIDRIMNYLKKMERGVWQSTERVEYQPLPRDL
jgi:Ca-activated chloride channel family protein